jgi:hypothetical protein
MASPRDAAQATCRSLANHALAQPPLGPPRTIGGGGGAERAHLENNTILTNHPQHSNELMITVKSHVLIDYKHANKKAPNRAGAMMSLPKHNHF